MRWCFPAVRRQINKMGRGATKKKSFKVTHLMIKRAPVEEPPAEEPPAEEPPAAASMVMVSEASVSVMFVPAFNFTSESAPVVASSWMSTSEPDCAARRV